MVAKLNVPANPEVGPMVALIGAALGGSMEEWESDSGATFHISHTQAGITACKKTLPGRRSKLLMGTFYR